LKNGVVLVKKGKIRKLITLKKFAREEDKDKFKVF